MVRIGKPASRSRAAAAAIRGIGRAGSCGLEAKVMAGCIVLDTSSQEKEECEMKRISVARLDRVKTQSKLSPEIRTFFSEAWSSTT
jgi:hypothetical protein